MLESWLTLFIVVTLVAVFISAYLMETRPILAYPFIIIGFMFSIVCAYGVWDVEFPVLLSNDTVVYESAQYGDPYSYIFVFLAFVFVMFFVRASSNYLLEKAKIKKEQTPDYMNK